MRKKKSFIQKVKNLLPKPKKKRASHAMILQAPRIAPGNRRKKKRSRKEAFTFSLPVKLRFIRRPGKKIFIFLGGFLVVGALSVIFLSPFFLIKDVVISRTDLYVNTIAISKALEGIKGKNILFLNTGQMETVLYDKFPEIKSVRVQRVLPRTLKIQLSSYDILARIQNEEGKEYLLNEAGVAVNMDSERPDLPLIVIPKYSDVPEEVREPFEDLALITEYKQIVSQEQLFFIMDIKRLFEENFQLPVVTIYYLPIEDEVRLHTERDSYIWASLRPSENDSGILTFGDEKELIEHQLNKLKQVLAQVNIYTDPIHYIDLRIGNKVIYCMKGEACEGVLDRLH